MKSLILMFLLIIASNVFCQKRYLNTVMIFEDVNSKKIRNQKSSFDFNEIQFNKAKIMQKPHLNNIISFFHFSVLIY